MPSHDRIRLLISLGITPETVLAESIVEIILRKSPEDSARWLTLYGDPLTDPISSVLLACNAGFDGSAILKSTLEIKDLLDTTVDKRSILASAMVELLLKSILSFPDIWDAAFS